MPWLSRVLALATQLDDDGSIDVFFFGTEAWSASELDVSNYRGGVDRLREGHRLGRTDYAGAIRAVRERFGLTGKIDKHELPVCVLFPTDGVPPAAAPRSTNCVRRRAIRRSGPVDCTRRRVGRLTASTGARVRAGVVGVGDGPRDVGQLQVPQLGRVVAAGLGGWRLLGADGAVVEPVAGFLEELRACGCSPSTSRSYCFDLMRWLRFLSAVEVPWQAAGREEVRDFLRWLRTAVNPARQRASGLTGRPPAGAVNATTGKAYLAAGYAPRTINHALSVLSAFYDWALFAGLVLRNPVPKQRGGRAAGRRTAARWIRLGMPARPTASGNPPGSHAACPRS